MSLPRRPEVQALVHIRPVVEEFAPSFVPGPGYGLLCSVLTSRARGTTKCPESLCLSLALPPSGRRVPPPPRTLLLSLRSYRLMRQSRVALPYFGFWRRMMGKADDTEEETGKCTRWDRRGRGPGIRGQICRDNVGRIPVAAGAGSNLRRLLARGLGRRTEEPDGIGE